MKHRTREQILEMMLEDTVSTLRFLQELYEIAAELAEGKRYLVSYTGHLFMLVDDKHIYKLKEASAFDFIEAQIGGFNKVAMTYDRLREVTGKTDDYEFKVVMFAQHRIITID